MNICSLDFDTVHYESSTIINTFHLITTVLFPRTFHIIPIMTFWGKHYHLSYFVDKKSPFVLLWQNTQIWVVYRHVYSHISGWNWQEWYLVKVVLCSPLLPRWCLISASFGEEEHWMEGGEMEGLPLSNFVIGASNLIWEQISSWVNYLLRLYLLKVLHWNLVSTWILKGAIQTTVQEWNTLLKVVENIASAAGNNQDQ